MIDLLTNEFFQFTILGLVTGVSGFTLGHIKNASVRKFVKFVFEETTGEIIYRIRKKDERTVSKVEKKFK